MKTQLFHSFSIKFSVFITAFLIISNLGFTQKVDLPIIDGPFSTIVAVALNNTRRPNGSGDAKFGIWAHWGPQCEPEDGDWYARNMYIEGSEQYKFHLKKYGHPSVFGFKDVINEWKADSLNAKYLLNFYKESGAKYFVGLASTSR